MVQVFLGLQWGDEGKGKIIDHFAYSADYVVRFQGGNNAGHTVITQGKTYVFHLLPSGVLSPKSTLVLEAGMVIDLRVLYQEVSVLLQEGIHLRLVISPNSHLLFPYHQKLDALQERIKMQKIGTTQRGIGPAYSDKINRVGIRFEDALKEETFKRKLRENVQEKNALFSQHGIQEENWESIFDEYSPLIDFFRSFVQPTFPLFQKALAEKKDFFIEGAQGFLLDLDQGTYPFVTSSSPSLGGVLSGTSLGIQDITEVRGIVKAYTTRVGEGVFPTELHGEQGDILIEKGKEYGSTTKRKRRCGWFDAVLTRYAIYKNAVRSLILTKIDILCYVDEIKVAVAYEKNGHRFQDYPGTLEGITVLYETFPSWKEDISGVVEYDDLPPHARNYIEGLERILQIPIDLISVGPSREQLIYRKK